MNHSIEVNPRPNARNRINPSGRSTWEKTTLIVDLYGVFSGKVMFEYPGKNRFLNRMKRKEVSVENISEIKRRFWVPHN